jgi:NAD(P)-dependent dehydrogenase (short-subunit alcohol dehydrogenase family)
MERSVRFAGKSAVVTGGGSGIGLATAERLAGEGARVLITDWNAKRGAEAAEALADQGLGVHFQHHDAGDPSSWAEVERRLGADFGGLHLLVNNAYSGVAASLDTLSPQVLRDSMRVNVEGAVLGMQLASRLMIAGGAVVNLSSVAAFSPNTSNLAYSTAKLAIIHLTQSAALDLARRTPAIRVNAVAPGATDTHSLRATLRALNRLPKDADLAPSLANVARRAPIGRVGAPAELAAAITFLLSEEASFITGQCLCVDGGASLV